MTILSLAAFSARSKLFPGRDNTIFDYRATDNKFVIVVITDDADKILSERKPIAKMICKLLPNDSQRLFPKLTRPHLYHNQLEQFTQYCRKESRFNL